MKRTLALRFAAIALGLGIAAIAQAAADAQTILSVSDAARNPSKPFAVTVSLLEYRNSKQTDGNTLTVYSKADAASGQRPVPQPDPLRGAAA